MAIDNDNEKLFLVNWGFGPGMQIPLPADGALSTADKQHLIDIYPGIAASSYIRQYMTAGIISTLMHLGPKVRSLSHAGPVVSALKHLGPKMKSLGD